jgi:hypothetical protein
MYWRRHSTRRIETGLDSLIACSGTIPLGGNSQGDKMLKIGFLSIALAAALIPFAQPAAAQNYQGPAKRTVQDYGPFPSVLSKNPTTATAGAANGKCGNPAGNCLFYGGDFLFDPLYPPALANGLANESTLFAPGTPYGAAVWVPVTVPAGEKWEVTGLFTNNLASFGVLDQGTQPTSVAYWSINEGMFAGSAGTVVDSGTSPATSTPTGRAAFGLSEYTVQVTGLSITLTAGSYWMAVVPVCTNTANPYCDGVFFESDVEYINTTPTNAFGPAEKIDASFFDSPLFGLSFYPANGPLGACGGFGCDAFSAGVLGKREK